MSNLIELQPMALPSEFSKAFVALKNVDIYYIGGVGKISQKGQVKNRVLVIVSEQLFCCSPNGDITIVIRLTEMNILLVKKTDLVVRTASQELWLCFPNEQICSEIVRILQGLYSRGAGSELPCTLFQDGMNESSHIQKPPPKNEKSKKSNQTPFGWLPSISKLRNFFRKRK
eukprot:TRINITY_DN1415_c2_g1_i3.p1 TRINITY_DN1415_c2_g1~~TRINITY_DN1415_c2_g1_i3.p1  ORF type:complete len:172 (+),score=25.78 TRINITY_DN1415_c2_g1_i3:96-611(+)